MIELKQNALSVKITYILSVVGFAAKVVSH